MADNKKNNKHGECRTIKQLRIEVEQWIKENPNSGLYGDIPNRSCWDCNEAHEHLKNADYPIQCFECGHIYYKGIKLTSDLDDDWGYS